MAKEKIESPTMKKTPAMSKKPRKPKTTTTHPPYFQMIKEALMALKEKNGSSPHAIAKQIEMKHKSVLPENFRKTLSLQLKNSVAKGKLVKIRASYKLSETNNTRTTTRSRSKKTLSLNKPEPVTKKKRKAKKKARQSKSIKSSGSKVLKASAT